MIRYFRFIFGAGIVAFCTGCGINTLHVTLEPYPAPQISGTSYSNGAAQISISSAIKSSDFKGYDVYLSTSAAILDQIQAGTIAPIKNPNSTYTIAAQSDAGIQSAVYRFTGLPNGSVYYATVRPVGENYFWAAATDNSKKIIFDAAQPVPLYPRPEGSFTIANQGNTTNARGFYIRRDTMTFALVSNSEGNVTNTVYYRVKQIGSVFYPTFKCGALSSASIQDIGSASELGSRTSVPTDGYFNKSSYIIIYRNHLYAVKNNNNYFKIYVSDAPDSSSLVSESTASTISGRWAYQVITNESRF